MLNVDALLSATIDVPSRFRYFFHTTRGFALPRVAGRATPRASGMSPAAQAFEFGALRAQVDALCTKTAPWVKTTAVVAPASTKHLRALCENNGGRMPAEFQNPRQRVTDH